MLVYDIADESLRRGGWKIGSLRVKGETLNLIAPNTGWVLVINVRGDLAILINKAFDLHAKVRLPQITKGMKREFVQYLYRTHVRNAMGVPL